jgi:hypothetical protein
VRTKSLNRIRDAGPCGCIVVLRGRSTFAGDGSVVFEADAVREAGCGQGCATACLRKRARLCSRGSRACEEVQPDLVDMLPPSETHLSYVKQTSFARGPKCLLRVASGYS